ncbi:MAG TPA: tetraacyldisaccharide 4'-kinase, partial [Nitrospiria bacterium]|nr:tetraacyldisaccharide 4'-kinase [Nitrospiria bacterium]
AAVQPKFPNGIPVCRVFFRGASFRNMKSGEEIQGQSLSGRKCLLVSGIADPASFRKFVESLGIVVERELVFPDHHKYLPDDLDAVENIARYRKVDAVITTDKDAVKWKNFNGNGAPVLVLKLTVSPVDPFPWKLIDGNDAVGVA